MKLWRIAAESRTYRADDLSGAGSAIYPGRWNEAGQAVVYTATTVSLAVLETAAHIDDAGLPLNRYLIEVDVPDDVWSAREHIDVATMPPTWSAIPAGQASAKAGSAWLASRRSPILLVPSVVVPEEDVALVNPAHAASRRITAQVLRLFEYNRLFRA